MDIHRYKFSLLLLALAVNSLSHAQTIPDAGVLRQQIEQGSRAIQPTPGIPEKVAPPPLRKLTGTTVTVKAFQFSGNTRVSSEVLQLAVAQFLNRPLDFAQLQDAAAAVGNVYREAGWVVRAYLPEQEIADGIVTIEIVEAVFGGARFEEQPPARFSNDKIVKYADAAQKAGEPLKAPAIDRALLLLSAIPGVAIAGNLREGKSSSETDLVFNVQDKPLFSGDAAIDNTGSHATGDKRLAANLNLNGPLRRGDQFSTNLMFTEGSNYGRLASSLPVGYDGWRIGVSGSYMTYKLVAPELVSLHALGSSSTFGVDANYPIIRSRLKNLYLALNYDKKLFDNEANSTTTTRYDISTFSAGLNADLVDKLAGGGMNNFGLTWVSGKVDLGGSPNQAADAFTSKTAGQFGKIRYSASRLQTVSENTAVYAAISGQAANKNLDSAEKFYLGGTGGVRAYPSSEGGGADGQLANIELRARLPHEVGFTGFYDVGRVTVNRDNGFFGAPALNSYSLQGLGVSVAWMAGLGINLKGTWARRIGNNPNPTLTGKDQDGTLRKNRFWLQATRQF